MSSHLARRNLRRQWLITAALAVGGILFVLPYLALATLAGLQTLNLTAILRSPGFHRVMAFFSLPQLFVFTAWERYLLAGLLTVALALAALRWGKPGRIIRVLLILTLLAVLFFPWLYRYEPAVIAAPGYAMRWPTQPDLLEGIARRNEISTERRPCTYTLLGWSAEEILYYQAICENGNRQVWAFDPDQSGSAQQTDAAPPNLSIGFRPRSQVLEQVRSPSVYPPEAEPYTRAIKVRADGLTSPDGRWVAIVARHLYGPEDVIVVSSSPILPTSTPSPTARESEWHAYQDPRLGLTFRYPPDWRQSVAFNYPLSPWQLKRIEITHLTRAAGDNAEILVDIRRRHGDLLEWFQETLRTQPGRLFITPSSVEGGVESFTDYNARLAGRPAIFVYAPEHGSGTPDMAQVYVADDQYFYVFTYFGDIPDNPANRAAYLRLLETVSLAGSTTQGLSLPETSFTSSRMNW